MRRLAIGLVALVLVLTALLVARIRRQAAAESGPAGGSGEIEGIEVNLSARIAARVVAWHAREGEAVKKGALLLTLDCANAAARFASVPSTSSRSTFVTRPFCVSFCTVAKVRASATMRRGPPGLGSPRRCAGLSTVLNTRRNTWA